MKREIALEFSRITEAAAIVAYYYLGRGDKIAADDAAVSAMRYILNQTQIDGKIVIGEGEIDEAPMLYIGEKVGAGGPRVDIAVDPIEGTRMVALGQSNALSVILAAEEGCLLEAPDMYMEKLVVNQECVGAIDIDLPLKTNLKIISKVMRKPLTDITMVTLEKERHLGIIKEVQALGVKVYAIPDGDVAASILTCMPKSEVDLMYCIGGAPEGVVSAGVIRALGGDMQGRLLLRKDVKEDPKNASESELARCTEMGVEVNKKLELNDLCSTDNVIFSATGVTKGDLLNGVSIKNNIAETQSLLIRGKSRTIRILESTHFLEKKDDFIRNIVKDIK
ncbi:class II fructose-bisphosphatase [Mycoplasmatota bacterium zrk1]